MRAKTKTQPKSQHTQANHPGAPPHPPALSHTPPPFVDRWHSQDRLRFPGPGEGRQSRREAGGGGGRGQADTQGKSLLSPARRAAQGLGAAAAGAPRSAPAPLPQHRGGTAPGSGQLAASSLPIIIVIFFPPLALSLSLSTSLSVGVISAFSAYRGSPLLHARCSPPEVSLGPAGIREAPGDFPTQAGVYEREGDQAQRRERCFQG